MEPSRPGPPPAPLPETRDVTALSRLHELKLHVRGAINNGLTRDEIKEVFLQADVYCGLPAGIETFRIARKVFKEMEIS